MTERLRIIGVGLLLLVVLSVRRDGGDRIDVPDVDVSGLHVLLMVDQSRPESVTAEQGAVLNSTKIPTEVRSQSGEYRRLDARDDLSGIDAVWRAMAAKMTDPPQMGVLRDKRLRVVPLPNSIDDAIEVIGK